MTTTDEEFEHIVSVLLDAAGEDHEIRLALKERRSFFPGWPTRRHVALRTYKHNKKQAVDRNHGGRLRRPTERVGRRCRHMGARRIANIPMVDILLEGERRKG